MIGIGRVVRGTMTKNQQVIVAAPDGKERKAKMAEKLKSVEKISVPTGAEGGGNVIIFN